MLRISVLLVAWLIGVWLTGCNSTGSSAAPTPAPAPAPAAAAAPQPASAVNTSAPATQGEYPGITLTIQELKRSSNVLTLKFVMANQSKQSFRLGAVGGVHLIDGTNKKKYFVVRDSDGACLCSRGVPMIETGAQAALWAKFPLPPDDVQKITVEIPHFPPFEDVAIGR